MNVDDLKNLFEHETGKQWSEADGVTWLMRNYEHLDLFTKKPVLDKSAHVTLSDKAGWLSQQSCRVCRAGAPISVIPVRLRPESWQSLKSLDKAAFKSAVRHRLANSPHVSPQRGRVCLTFLFVCSVRRKTRDLDNMAKILMDSIKGIVMGDDAEVDHLNLMRLTHEGDEEFVFFRISESHFNNHNDVAAPILQHSWAGAEMLILEDFRKPK